MQGKEVCYQTVRKVKNPKYQGCDIWLAAMADSKHTTFMVNTWGITHKHDKRRQRVKGSLGNVNYSEYMYWYHFECHAVNGNNYNFQGHQSFEETFTPYCWELRQFGLMIVVCQVNSILAHNTLVCYNCRINAQQGYTYKGVFKYANP